MAVGKRAGNKGAKPSAPPPASHAAAAAAVAGDTNYSHWTQLIDAHSLQYTVAIHPELPADLPVNQGELFFECTLFLYSCLALFLQYVNLYKTMWWLPNAHVTHPIKLYLIDPYLLSCVGLILGRRVTLCFLSRITIIPPDSDPDQVPWILRFVETVLKIPMFGAVMSSFMFSFLRVLHTYSLASLTHLFFPILVYVMMFYHELMYRWWGPALGISSHPERHPGQAHPWDMIDIEHSRHCCTANNGVIRKEATLLYVDAVQRIKRSIFSAFAVAYYAVYLPTCFTPPTLLVDSLWVLEMSAIVFTSSCSLYLTYMFPLQYCDLIHRCASHLGGWKRVKLSPSAGPISCPNPCAVEWDSSRLYRPGVTYYFDKASLQQQQSSSSSSPASGSRSSSEAYLALGTHTTVANHNNRQQHRFYLLARQAVRPLNVLCALQLACVLSQLLMLIHSHEWQHIVTLVALMAANYMLLFKLFKDKIILDRCYSTENPSFPTNLPKSAAAVKPVKID